MKRKSESMESNNKHVGPKYILRVESLSGADQVFSIWQLPASSTPHILRPIRIAGLYGRNLAMFESRLLHILQSENIDPTKKSLESKI